MHRVKVLAVFDCWAMVKRTTFGMVPTFNLIPYVCHRKELIANDGRDEI